MGKKKLKKEKETQTQRVALKATITIHFLLANFVNSVGLPNIMRIG